MYLLYMYIYDVSHVNKSLASSCNIMYYEDIKYYMYIYVNGNKYIYIFIYDMRYILYTIYFSQTIGILFDLVWATVW